MSFRTVVITSQCKLSYKNEYMQIFNEKLQYVHLSEISVLIIESMQVTITAVLLSELSKHKIKVIFCDECHNPYGELSGYYDRFNSSKKIALQICWDNEIKVLVSDKIITQKILNQSKLLKKGGFCRESEMLKEYALNVKRFDSTNREGHAAKVYFNALFGKSFSREDSSDINAKLNYGYSIILSCINREVVANGCMTQIGIKHINEYNNFNLSCDIIEVFRVIVDEFVFENVLEAFDSDFKHKLANILNKQILLDKQYYLSNAIAITTKSVIDALNANDIRLLRLYNYI